ncbi:hypothetical protein OAU72_02190 [Hyphomicrobiales bacterium]|jgi:hypothetical protein|nr:hypothetical protein [Hyphomicrobiales bacterium]|tara:strand:+ start:1739 stop:2098 length:360 start_codon:yes stop_codon:yes gene_type:complete
MDQISVDKDIELDANNRKAPAGLKFAVIFMGVLLVIGFIVVFITIGYRVANPEADNNNDNILLNNKIMVKPDSLIVDINNEGKKTLITIRNKDESYDLITLDTSKGIILNTFTFYVDSN